MVRQNKIRRKLIQFTAMLVYNADVTNWFSGGISRSVIKNVCVPGLNCYSCPGAISSCPLGSIQNIIANGKFPFFVTGFLMLTGTLIGRMVCGFLCPAGLIQELLYKIPSKKIRKTQRSVKITRKIALFKYLLLGVLCILLPLIFFLRDGLGSPFFCKSLCPAGTLGAGLPLMLMNETLRSALGLLFSWKMSVAIVFVVWSVFMFRPFCRFFCPLGAAYSFFNKIAVFGIKRDDTKCTHCNACTLGCQMDTLNVNDRECIRCNECIARCRFGALNIVTLGQNKIFQSKK
ncbi:4Fe-4S binding protein [Treponema parvum]|nr:4Fe-4S binding protein [Treponema parvum]